MPELPEIVCRANEMKKELSGKTISGIQVLQPKCLNLPEKDFVKSLTGGRIRNVTNRGKWILIDTTKGWLLLNLGMGGEILLVDRTTLPDKKRLIIDFEDGTCLAINFWWFGYAHYVARLEDHEPTAKLGPNALDLGCEDLKALLKGRQGRIKSFLLNQDRIAGIGNAYIHDILFLAGLHPLKPISAMGEKEIEGLYEAIQQGLKKSIKLGGAFYEKDLYGNPGGFTDNDIIIGYKEGKPCPKCGTPIKKIKTGSTSSFVCPQCQPLD